MIQEIEGLNTILSENKETIDDITVEAEVLNEEISSLQEENDRIRILNEEYRELVIPEGDLDKINIYIGQYYWGEYDLSSNEYSLYRSDLIYDAEIGHYSFYASESNKFNFMTTVDVNEFENMIPFRRSSVTLRNNAVASSIECNSIEREEYNWLIADILDDRGLSNVPVIIKDAFTFDIDGDGNLEVLLYSSNIVKDSNRYRATNYGDYNYNESEIGAYDLLILYHNENVLMIRETVRVIGKDFRLMTSEELDENDLMEHYSLDTDFYLSAPIYLFDDEGEVRAYSLAESGEVIWDGGIYNLGVLDVDKDGSGEIIMTSSGMYTVHSIYDFLEGELIAYHGMLH